MARPRTKPNRRPLNAAQQAQPTQMGWGALQISPGTVEIALELPCSITGTPAMFVVNEGGAPSGLIVLDNQHFTLDFGDISPGASISVPAYDPAVRSADGGYMAPISVQVLNPPGAAPINESAAAETASTKAKAPAKKKASSKKG